MDSTQRILEAAIAFNEEELTSSNEPGALHFLGVMRLDPRHVGRNSPVGRQLTEEIEVDNSSFLFKVAEAIELAVGGKIREATRSLAAIDPTSGVERLFVSLVLLWLEPTKLLLAEAETQVRDLVTLSADMRARIYLKFMTWALVNFGIEDAQPFYDAALELSSGSLREVIQRVGGTFNRDTYYTFPPTEDATSLYPRVDDRATRAVADFAITSYKKRIAPFSRTFGGDPATLPLQFRAAEMQAGWIGALWLLKRIWRLKAALLLENSDKPSEQADGITAWLLSDGSDTFRLVNENEHRLTREIIDKVLVDDLNLGASVKSATWVELCSALWDELPPAVSDQLISAGVVGSVPSTDDSTPDEDRASRLFANMVRVDPARWSDRYWRLTDSERLSVATAARTTALPAMPDDIRTDVMRLLFAQFSDKSSRSIVTEETCHVLATLVNDLPSNAPEVAMYRINVPTHYAASVGLSFPRLLNYDAISAELGKLKQTIRKQLTENRSGRWAGYGRSIGSSCAQSAVAIHLIDDELVELMVDFSNAPFSSANDIIGTVRGLSWMLDESLIPDSFMEPTALSYRANLSPIDKYWTGRNDLRAINAAIAGYRARFTEGREESAIERLIVAARDPDLEVRALALSEFNTLKSKMSPQPALDTMILGAIYDPDYRIQQSAIDIVDVIHDGSVHRLAWERLSSQWHASHRSVRITAALAAERALEGSRPLESQRQLVVNARIDRSLLVREVVGRTDGHP